MNNLQALIDECVASGMAEIYVIIGFLLAILAEGVGSLIAMYWQRYRESNNHPKKLIVSIDLGKLPNNVYRYHQLLRKRSHEDWEHHLISTLEDNFTITHTDEDLKDIYFLDK